jgi:60 kDa SS-A/Ro ribonucleoprotein
MDYAKQLSERQTPQSEKIPGSTQVPNSAGGFAWPVDDWTRLDRFLVLGNEGGPYYARERTLTVENAAGVLRCLALDGPRAVARIAAVSDAGRAPKNDPAIFALSLAVTHGDSKTKAAALATLPAVCRVGTHLFHFLQALEQLRPHGPKEGHAPNGGPAVGVYGRSVRRGLGRWYTGKDIDALAYQAIKYQQRDGWAHRDVLRLAHPKTDEAARARLLRWMVGKPVEDAAALPALVRAFLQVQAEPSDVKAAVRLIRQYDLPREALPTELLQSADVWAALQERMPMTALIRNLPTLTRVGVCAPLSAGTQHVVAQLGDADRLRKARIHPIQLLAALRTYAQGHGERGKAIWEPVGQIVDALDGAFYLAYGNLTPSTARHVLALDVSGSMGGGNMGGVPGLTPREGACAMALVLAHQYPANVIIGFTTSGPGVFAVGGSAHGPGYAKAVAPLEITAKWRLDQATAYVARLPFGGTDCALPMLWAEAEKVQADAFTVITDNETWAGNIHPSQALRQYRQRLGIPAKCAVIGMTATQFSIADPADAGMLDVVGFDTAVPQLLTDFIG